MEISVTNFLIGCTQYWYSADFREEREATLLCSFISAVFDIYWGRTDIWYDDSVNIIDKMSKFWQLENIRIHFYVCSEHLQIETVNIRQSAVSLTLFASHNNFQYFPVIMKSETGFSLFSLLKLEDWMIQDQWEVRLLLIKVWIEQIWISPMANIDYKKSSWSF